MAWWLIARITPWLRSSQESYYELLESLIRPAVRILDVGCGKQFLMSWLKPDDFRRWSASILDQAVIFGIDPYLPSLRQNSSRLTACSAADRLPFADAGFDIVTANMVVEHLAEPDTVLPEVFRVLKPGGAFLFHTPNLGAPQVGLANLLPHALLRVLAPLLEGRRADDVFPTHYRLNTREAVAAAAPRSGFRLEVLEHVHSSPVTQMLGPLVVFELLWMRLLRRERFASRRPALICLLRKPAEAPPNHATRSRKIAASAFPLDPAS